MIGDKPVAAVTLADVREIVLPHWDGRNSTGYTLRQNLEYVMETAVIEKAPVRQSGPRQQNLWVSSGSGRAPSA